MFSSFVFLLGILSLSRGLQVGIDLDHLLAKVEPEFVSVTIDSAILNPPKWAGFNFR